MMSLGAIILFSLMIVSVIATETSEPDGERTLSNGNSKFTQEFFELIRNKTGNLFFSPLSIEMLLALVHAGAGGTTASQIQQAVHLPETPEKSAKLYGDLMNTLTSDKNIILNLANALFADKQFSIRQDYLDLARNKFKAEMDVVDFKKAEEAARTINSYVAKNTGNKISKLLDPNALGPFTKLIMLNAIYFKADWLLKFPKAETRKRNFHLTATERKNVDFMRLDKALAISKNEELDAKIVALPYKGRSVSMILVVPNQINGLADLESKIACMDLNVLTGSFYPRDVILTMPKFKLEQQIDLTDILKKMGITDLFNKSSANLTRISDQQIFASQSVQKALIEVDEDGTEAAAATYVEQFESTFSRPPPPKVVITVDRPFLFFIKHEPTGLQLFAGRVTSP